MNFNDYKNSKKTIQELSPDAKKMMADFLSKNSAKNPDELMQNIIELATTGRKNGTLSDDDIDNFYKLIKPMLSQEQVKMLDKVVADIKSI